MLGDISFVSCLVLDRAKSTQSKADVTPALGQANAAQALWRTLPPNLTSAVEDLEDEDYQLLEHEDVIRLFGVFACHELVDEVLGRIPKAT